MIFSTNENTEEINRRKCFTNRKYFMYQMASKRLYFCLSFHKLDDIILPCKIPTKREVLKVVMPTFDL